MNKIINDPVHGFLSFPEQEVLQIIDHRCFQRLRHIMQMGVANLVYPGAVHTRFLHSLGACHLMGKALDELGQKGFAVSQEERTAARLAVLLHDIGHGPFSHALEHSLIAGIKHEDLSRLIIGRLNTEFGGMLSTALSIFDFSYPKKYLHQLVSGQLDVDRLDYLSRDSFYSGVTEGVIGYDRILKMLTVRNNELAVEEKGIYSVEKFIIARHIMYWQVYLHKTVLGAEMLLGNILKRAKEISLAGKNLPASEALSFFLKNDVRKETLDDAVIDHYCELDDSDIILAIKNWARCDDKVLSELCSMHLHRKLYKVIYDADNELQLYAEKQDRIRKALDIDESDLHYFVNRGIATNSAYNPQNANIMIAQKDGSLRNLADMPTSLVHAHQLANTVSKPYIYYRAVN